MNETEQDSRTAVRSVKVTTDCEIRKREDERKKLLASPGTTNIFTGLYFLASTDNANIVSLLSFIIRYYVNVLVVDRGNSML